MALSVFGELDQATVPRLHEGADPLISGDCTALLLDLSDCAFVDSSGLAAFVAIRDRVTAIPNRGFAICCPDTQVSRLMELTGLDRALGLAESRDEALAALRGHVSPEPA